MGARARAKLVRREPSRAVPLPDRLAHLRLRKLEFQQTVGPDGPRLLIHRNDRRRPAEVATLRRAIRIKDRDRLAALALHGFFLRRPATLIRPDGAQCLGEIVLPDVAPRAERRRRDSPAIRAHERLLRGIPLRLRAATRAVVFLLRFDLVAHVRRIGIVGGNSVNSLEAFRILLGEL